jgi:hypothetical protein
MRRRVENSAYVKPAMGVPSRRPGDSDSVFQVEVILQHWGLSSEHSGAAIDLRSLSPLASMKTMPNVGFWTSISLWASLPIR